MADQQLVGYVSESISSGISKEEIVKVLTGVGWPQTEIDDAFLNLEKTGEKALPASPVVAAVDPAVYSGDVSGVSVYDLGITHNWTEKNHEDKNVIGPNADVVLEDKKTKEAEFPYMKPPNDVVENGLGVNPQADSGLKYLWIGGIIFVLLALVGLIFWWFVVRDDPDSSTTVDVDQQISPQLVTNANQSGVGLDLKLSEAPYISQKGFEIVTPDGWAADESGAFGTLVTFSNPTVDVDSGNRYAANINIVAEPDQGASLDEYLSSSRKILTETFSSYVEISVNKLMVGEKEAVVLEAKYDMGAYSLHNTQLIVKSDGQFFVITGTAFDSLWNKYMSVMNGSLLSFR